ncbi:MAG: glycogen synthase GlgA [Deltaproteobacteria bacterium]|nr:glycogen synthase GlgA [Deltaproteobacteria bacterium]
MRVLHVASEVAPFAQSGGLADVVAGLPAALAESHGLTTGILVPLYRGVAERVAAAGITLEPGVTLPLTVGPHAYNAAVRIAQVGRVRYGFLECAALYDRDGLYGPGGSSEFPDNHLRFGALGKAALTAGHILFGDDRPKAVDVLHVHDWQGASAAIYARAAGLEGRPVPAVVATIHNLAYRGIYPKSTMDDLGMPWSLFTPHQLEFWDQLCLLKGGLALADAATTVSPSYAREILTPERGEALDGFLRWDIKRLVGIVNGIDIHAWDPATDPALPANFSINAIAGKARCRAALAAEFGLPITDAEPLIGVVARMTDQKGLDLVAQIAPELHRLGARLVVLGSGEPALESQFRYLADVFKDHVAVRIGFDIDLSRRIYGGSDLFVMPSRFEPCGLGQLYAMRYGAIPIVHAVGGLRDTVIDPGDEELARGRGTGIRFEAATSAYLAHAIERAVALYRNPTAWSALRRAAMARDSSWTASAQQYVQLYRSFGAR